MKNLLNSTLLLCLTVLIIQACAPKEKAQQDVVETTSQEKAIEVKPGFVHAVYFWLDTANIEVVDEFINQGLPMLAEIPSIQSVSWGPPAGTPRNVVDNSYDLAWIVNFASSEDHDAYQVDSLHVAFVEKYKFIFKKVQVYDNVVNMHIAN